MPAVEDRLLLELGNGPHRLCGDHRFDSALCPNCRHKLLHVATLNVKADTLLSDLASREQKLVLLFCWRCPAAKRLQYRVLNDVVAIFEAESGNEEPGFPYAAYPDSFPEISFSLYRAPDEDLTELGDWNECTHEVEVPRHEIGGQPRTWQSISSPTCSACGSIMEYLATVGDANNDPRGFTNNVGVMMLFFVCPHCEVIHATHQVD